MQNRHLQTVSNKSCTLLIPMRKCRDLYVRGEIAAWKNIAAWKAIEFDKCMRHYLQIHVFVVICTQPGLVPLHTITSGVNSWRVNEGVAISGG